MVAGVRAALPQGVRFTVLRRDGFTCRYCGRSSPDVVLHIDHVVAVAQGGTDELSNLATACADCNLGKGARVGGATTWSGAGDRAGRDGLGGVFAHELDGGYAERQLEILSRVGAGWLVRYFSWWDGLPSGCVVIPERDLVSDRYALYPDAASMQFAYRHGGRCRPVTEG